MSTYDVSIVQPYVPGYRVPVFDALDARLRARGLRLQVVAPMAAGVQARRQDAASGREWHTVPKAGRTVTVGGVAFTSLASAGAVHGSRVVILPLWGTLLDAHRALWAPRPPRPRVGLWGHVDAFVKPANRIDVAVERVMMQRADRVFAYTERGGRFAQQQGVPPDRVTVLHNTVETADLLAAIETLSDGEVDAFRRSHGLVAGKTFAYLGGLDTDKRIDYLAEVLDVLWVLDPSRKVVVGGRGADEPLLDAAVRRGQAVMLGHVGTAEKALIARTSTALLNPGRIGLLAVDALAMGLPVITTDFKYHGPEVDYLADGTTLVRVDGDAGAYAHRALEIRNDPAPTGTASPPPLSAMVTRFEEGIVAML